MVSSTETADMRMGTSGEIALFTSVVSPTGVVKKCLVFLLTIVGFFRTFSLTCPKGLKVGGLDWGLKGRGHQPKFGMEPVPRKSLLLSEQPKLCVII